MRRPWIAVALTGALAAVAGCGSGESEGNRYVEAVNQAQSGFAANVQRLESQIKATSTPEEDRRTLTQFRQAVDRVVGRLQAIEPPRTVEAQHRRLIRVIGRYGTEIARFRRAAASPDPQRVLRAQTSFNTQVSSISGDINATITAINEELDG